MVHTNRNKYIDVLRGIAILLMIIGHSIQFGGGIEYYSSNLFYDNYIFKLIYGFHMPLFAIISGYLFYISNNKKNFKEKMLSIYKTLLIPILIWSLIPILIFLIKNYEHEIIYIVKSTLMIAVNNLWYLWALIIFQLIFIIGKKYTKDNLLFYIILLVVFVFIPDFFQTSLIKNIYPFFVIGYYSNKCNIQKKLSSKKISAVPMIVILISYLVLLYFYSKEKFVYVSGVSLFLNFNMNQIYIDIYRTIVALLGCIGIILLIQQIKISGFIERFLLYVGKNSLGIYAINSTFCNLFILKITKSFSPNIIFYIATFLLSIIIAIGINIIIKKIKWLNILMLGGKES